MPRELTQKQIRFLAATGAITRKTTKADEYLLKVGQRQTISTPDNIVSDALILKSLNDRDRLIKTGQHPLLTQTRTGRIKVKDIGQKTFASKKEREKDKDLQGQIDSTQLAKEWNIQ